ncbi:lipoyl(octanoyl) transferase [Halospina denitrificans]|uniref:Octanoyltransferase n=1 Tax=Halospina denitrificans TaxID=332522 RepID=A0A4V3EPI0_9GAMM|nr:lipoyl(octanoyl) transferase LipB [Halospina denitrificans]TDT37838.1 lipoyl(octanoyl) transferase [Halospina denitrificans]
MATTPGGNREPLAFHRYGRRPYKPVFEAMKAFTDARDETTPDQCWLLEHEPVFTQGQAGRAEHVLAPGDIPVVQVDRGGQVTYHGPGQLMVYPLIDLARRRLGVREFVTLLESLTVATLARWGIEAAPRRDAPGVYVEGRKVASLGLRVRRGRAYHGLAINVDMDLAPFQRINPCGYAGMPVTRLSDLTSEPVTLDGVAEVVEQELCYRLSEKC